LLTSPSYIWQVKHGTGTWKEGTRERPLEEAEGEGAVAEE